MDVGSATREIFWQIPFSFKVVMYVVMFVALGILLKGLWDRYKSVVEDRGFFSLVSPKHVNYSGALSTILFTGKVTRKRWVGIFHSMIYYGFTILLIATELVAIHADTPFQVYKGPVYIVVSFLADWAGLAIIIGLAFAYHRRYIKRPDYLSSTKPKRELFMYGMILALVLLGYLLEALRLIGSGMPVGEQLWSPVGWVAALILGSISWSDNALVLTYQVTWMIHMINTMFFLACIPYTKFLHMFSAPFAALVTPKRRGAIMMPMDFEDETAETFGLGKSSELNSKHRLDMMTCVECGRCTEVCPANLAGKPLNPKTIITKMRDAMELKETPVDFWEEELYSATELDSCTTCGACMEECPVSIEHVQQIMGLKRYKALTLGQIPPEAATAVTNIRNNGNPWGVSQDDRFNWAADIEVPVIEAGKKVDYLYYVGCAGSYDDANQKVVQDTVSLLTKAGVDFAVMGKTEKCNGDPIRRFGDEYSFQEIAIENIANMNQYQFDKVVTHCPHCLHTIGKEYAKFEKGQFETIHHTELLADLLKTKRLVPAKQVDESFTFHDPCYLGRHHGEYNAPREVLSAVPGIKITEMEKNKDKSLCCGMGGGNMWYEIHEGVDMVENRLVHIGETKVSKLATGCSFCMINFNSGKGKVAATENIEVEDVASVLRKSIE